MIVELFQLTEMTATKNQEDSDTIETLINSINEFVCVLNIINTT